jgi:amino acid transporter
MVQDEGMAKTMPNGKSQSAFRRWFFQGQVEEGSGPFEPELRHKTHSWWQVMCLTGVDYFSTLGYQPGIAALAAGVLSPIATLILVLLTLFGALPIYRYVAAESPHGEGSIAMLERLLGSWLGKLFVLVLLGFVATDFIITITLSAADATAHVIENPFTHSLAAGHSVGITLVMVALLGAIFLKGFKEAIGIAVALVSVYLLMNIIVVAEGLIRVVQHPVVFGEWRHALFAAHSSPLLMVGVALLLFPKLALGLSGFETGVVLMPLVKGMHGDKYEKPTGRIVNTRKLLVTAAIIMSVFLLTSSLVTTLLIPAHEFADAGAGHEAGKANGRALAYLAHLFFGDKFGTAYDISTILILWFAGASAMAGLLNIVPRYLPRYGMAPDWTRATRPLAVVFTVIAFAVTVHFKADVNAQGGAYATGVLVLMTSAAVAVTISIWHKRRRGLAIAFSLIAAVFLYTTVVNVIERPDGIKIASFFIVTIICTSLLSRVWRVTELRVGNIVFDEVAQRFLAAAGDHEMHIIANKRQTGAPLEYNAKEKAQREHNRIPAELPVLFLEVEIKDASEFSNRLFVRGAEVSGHRILRVDSPVVPNAIAAILLHLRDSTGKVPHAYFSWSDGNPMTFLLRYIAMGEGDTAPATHEVLRKAEPDPERRPAIHVGGER